LITIGKEKQSGSDLFGEIDYWMAREVVNTGLRRVKQQFLSQNCLTLSHNSVSEPAFDTKPTLIVSSLIILYSLLMRSKLLRLILLLVQAFAKRRL
jgi:hypothetical protein